MYFVLDTPDTVFLLPDLKFLFTEYWISYPVTYRFFFHVICAFLPDRFFAVVRVVPAGFTVTVILFVAALYPAVAEERIVILALPVNFAAMVILPCLSTFTDLLLEEYFSGAFPEAFALMLIFLAFAYQVRRILDALMVLLRFVTLMVQNVEPEV